MNPTLTSNGLIYEQYDMLNHKKINVFLVGKFMYNLYHGMAPLIFAGILLNNYDILDHNTRISNYLHAANSFESI